MHGEYIKDRWIVKMIQSLCKQMDIGFLSWSDDWILELQKDAKIQRVIGYRFGLNDSVASNISQDKAATYTLLAAKSIPAVRHELVRTKASALNENVFDDWNGVVVKPLVGTSGHGVHKFEKADEAAKHIDESAIQAWAVSPYIAIVVETRVILLDGTPLLAYEKRPVELNGLKMFNLGLGGAAVNVTPSDHLLELAKQAQEALGLRLCAVDIVEGVDGQLRVLEVNDGIMMEHYARQSESNAQRALEVYKAIVERLFTS